MKQQIFNAPNGFYVFDIINDSDWQKNDQVRIGQVIHPGKQATTFLAVRSEVKRWYDSNSVFVVFSHYEDENGNRDEIMTKILNEVEAWA